MLEREEQRRQEDRERDEQRRQEDREREEQRRKEEKEYREAREKVVKVKIPPLEDKDNIDEYLSQFEKIAENQGWKKCISCIFNRKTGNWITDHSPPTRN